jgi:hypothetical protein
MEIGNKTGEPTATQKPATKILEDLGKAIPALAAIVVVLSLVFETSFLLRVGIGFLSYYSWQDFIRNAVIWIPSLLLAVIWPLFVSAGLVMSKRQASDIKRLEGELVELGGTVPSRQKLRLWARLKRDARTVSFWMYLLGAAFSIFLLVLEAYFAASLSFVLTIWAYYSTSPRLIEDLGDAFSKTFLESKAVVSGLLFALLIAALLGGAESALRLGTAETTRVQLKGNPSDAANVMHCNVLRALNAALLAMCNGQMTVINNSFIESVTYDVKSK